MNGNKISTLDPKLQPLAREFIARGDLYLAKDPLWKDYHLLITEAKRDIYLQAGLYSQGRVWNKVQRHWLEIDRGTIVTRTLESKHLQGLAFDVCLSKISNPAYWPDPKTVDGKALWIGLGNIAVSLGMQSGAFWPEGKEDWDHYEI